MQNSMETYAQQTLLFGEDELTSLQAVSPASRSRSRASAKARRTTATSGRKCCGLFGLFDLDGSWARTFSELLIGRKEWSSSRCVLTWRRRDMRFNRTLYRLAVSALPTEGTDAGLLPTAQTQGLKQCKNGKTVFMPLSLLPTPTANEYKSTSNKLYLTKTGTIRKHTSDGKSGQVGLEILATKGMLPTPSARDWKGPTNPGIVKPGSGYRYGNTFPDSIRGMWPTPKANDFRSGMPNRVGTEHTQQLNDTVSSPTGTTSQLNPRFVAEMMGFPVDWTVLPFLNGETCPSKPTETPSCLK